MFDPEVADWSLERSKLSFREDTRTERAEGVRLGRSGSTVSSVRLYNTGDRLEQDYGGLNTLWFKPLDNEIMLELRTMIAGIEASF